MFDFGLISVTSVTNYLLKQKSCTKVYIGSTARTGEKKSASEEKSARFDSFWLASYQEHQQRTGGTTMGGLPSYRACSLAPWPPPKYVQGGAESVKTRLDELPPPSGLNNRPFLFKLARLVNN